jgi:hypothetical protein
MATFCASVRKKGSTDPCGSKALLGHTLCGTHARAKTVTLWVDANKGKVLAVYRIQALARGWIVRSRLRLAGPGVLHREGLCNDDDLETCETSDRQYPLDYFAFTENGKVWWFDFATLWKWVQLSVEPINPYTKVRLTADTTHRLRRMWSARRRARQVIPPESSVFQERLRNRWTLICQIFVDNGFGVTDPELFAGFTKNDYIVLFRSLRDTLQASLPIHQTRGALTLIHRCLLSAWTLPPTQFSLQASYALMALMLHSRNEFGVAFCVLSALYHV